MSLYEQDLSNPLAKPTPAKDKSTFDWGKVITWGVTAVDAAGKQIKANNAQKARQAAQLQAQVTKSTKSFWDDFANLTRTYKVDQIRASTPPPGSPSQSGLTQDKAAGVQNFLMNPQTKMLAAAGAVLLIFMAVKK